MGFFPAQPIRQKADNCPKKIMIPKRAKIEALKVLLNPLSCRNLTW